MRTLSGALILALSTAVAVAADGKYTLTGDNTRVEFTGAKKEGKHDGGFKKLAGTATLTGTDPASAKIQVTIDTESLYSDNEKLTAHLKAPDFFERAFRHALRDEPSLFEAVSVDAGGELDGFALRRNIVSGEIARYLSGLDRLLAIECELAREALGERKAGIIHDGLMALKEQQLRKAGAGR